MDELLTRTIKLPLDVGDEGQLLLRTMYLGTKVFNAHAEWGFAKKVFDNAEMHRAIYKNICEEFPSVPSNLILSCRDAACSSLRSMNSQNRWKTKPQKKGYSALKYPHASVGLDFNACTVSLSCVRPKRPVKATFLIPRYYERYINWHVTRVILVFRRDLKRFFLHVSLATNKPPIRKGECLGIDKGLKIFLMLSNKQCVRGDILKQKREYYSRRRRELLKLGTRSALRKFRSLSGKEKRSVNNYLHEVVNFLLKKPYRLYGVEDLKGIVKTASCNRKLRAQLAVWPYAKFDRILTYKAEALGKCVIKVPPAYTSQQCSRCSYRSRANRRGDSFKCKKCNFSTHSDFNASLNIRSAAVNQPNGAFWAPRRNAKKPKHLDDRSPE